MFKMKSVTKSKVKTTIFWSGIISSLILFTQSIAAVSGYDIPQEAIGSFLAAANSLLATLTFSGILVNPENVESFQAFKAKMKK